MGTRGPWPENWQIYAPLAKRDERDVCLLD